MSEKLAFARFDPDDPVFQERASVIMSRIMDHASRQAIGGLVDVHAYTPIVSDMIANARVAIGEGMNEEQALAHVRKNGRLWTDEDLINAASTFTGDTKVEVQIRDEIRTEQKRRAQERETRENEENPEYGLF